MSDLTKGDTIQVHNRDAEIIKIVGDKMRIKYANGGIGTEYVARHELPDSCKLCGSKATHRVEVNAPGNGDCYGACESCAESKSGRYVTVHKVKA